MAWTQTSDDLATAPRHLRPGPTQAEINRLLGMAAHPSTMGTAPKVHEVNLDFAYTRIIPAEKHLLNYPRATIRQVRGVNPDQPVYVAKIWFGPDKPVIVNGRWVTKTSGSKPEVFWWAQRAVEHFRDITEFWKTGTLGAAHRRWAPEW